jgi:hypothetical protein
MNAHGRAGLAAGIIGAVSVLLTHAAAADEVLIVSGLRIDKPEPTEFAPAEPEAVPAPVELPAEIRESIHDEVRESLRDSLQTLRLTIEKDEAAPSEAKVASLGAQTGA